MHLSRTKDTLAGPLWVRHLIRSPAPGELHLARVTVVNDYPAFLEMMRAMLGEAGHEVTTFDGETSSLAEIRSTRPELLIIDVMAKGEGSTGWDVIGLARADDELRRVPIVVCTADVVQSGPRLEELERTGNIHVLQKPFSSAELHQLIGPLLLRGLMPG